MLYEWFHFYLQHNCLSRTLIPLIIKIVTILAIFALDSLNYKFHSALKNKKMR